MKTSIKPLLNYRKDREGRYALIIQIIHGRQRSILTTPYRLKPEEFSANKGLAIPYSRNRTHVAYIRTVNNTITHYLTELRRIAEKLQHSGELHTASDITKAYKQSGNCHYFFVFAEQLVNQLESEGRYGTARSYRSLMRSWARFTHSRQQLFAQIDHQMVYAFTEYLACKGNKRNTIIFYLRTLRALYNRARTKGYAPADTHPFQGISFKPQQTPKLALRREILRKLAATDFREPELNEARDMFLFSFYARGMSFVDMAYLRKDNIWDNTLHYQRHKTHQVFRIAITPQLQELLQRYNNPLSSWALPCMERGKSQASSRHNEHINNNLPDGIFYQYYCVALQYYLLQLKKISELLGCPGLTFNAARHTWATEAHGLGVPMPYISAGLGHTTEQMTRRYLAQLDNSMVDNFNAKVTDLRKL